MKPATRCAAAASILWAGCFSPNTPSPAGNDSEASQATSTSPASDGQTSADQTSAPSTDPDGTAGTTTLSDSTLTSDPTLASESSGSEMTSMPTTTTTADDGTDSSTGGPVDTSRSVFVLQDTVAPADYGGLAGADALCQTAADDAGLEGTYFAWLSATDSDDPDDRFDHRGGPFVRTDGIIIADDWADLTDGELLAPIDHAADGSLADQTQSGVPVITATAADGTHIDSTLATCASYTADLTFEPDRGSLLEIDTEWSAIGDTWDCGVAGAGLYCFEQ